jgi:hypothetical protein
MTLTGLLHHLQDSSRFVSSMRLFGVALRTRDLLKNAPWLARRCDDCLDKPYRHQEGHPESERGSQAKNSEEKGIMRRIARPYPLTRSLSEEP